MSTCRWSVSGILAEIGKYSRSSLVRITSGERTLAYYFHAAGRQRSALSQRDSRAVRERNGQSNGAFCQAHGEFPTRTQRDASRRSSAITGGTRVLLVYAQAKGQGHRGRNRRALGKVHAGIAGQGARSGDQGQVGRGIPANRDPIHRGVP